MIAYHATPVGLPAGTRLWTRTERPRRKTDRETLRNSFGAVHPAVSDLRVLSACYVAATLGAAVRWSAILRCPSRPCWVGPWWILRVHVPDDVPVEVHAPGDWSCDGPHSSWRWGSAREIPSLWTFGDESAEVRVFSSSVTVLGPA